MIYDFTPLDTPQNPSPQNPSPQNLPPPPLTPSPSTLWPYSNQQQQFETLPFPSYGTSSDNVLYGNTSTLEALHMQEYPHHYQLDHYDFSTVNPSVLMQPPPVTMLQPAVTMPSTMVNPQLQTMPSQPVTMLQPAVTMPSTMLNPQLQTMPSQPVTMPLLSRPREPTISRPQVIQSEEVKSTKGTHWTVDEQRLFLIGLEKYKKGDWKNISRNVVKTRSPTQVASHAQKFFSRKNKIAGEKKRKRSSIHTIDKVDENTVNDLKRKGLLNQDFDFST